MQSTGLPLLLSWSGTTGANGVDVRVYGTQSEADADTRPAGAGDGDSRSRAAAVRCRLNFRGTNG